MTENIPSGRNRGNSNTTQKMKGNRNPKSCERCRIRKTKCVDPIPGPCQYCARIGAMCGVADTPKKRPYYRVSEQEYQCSMQILRHLLPDRDLTPEVLLEIAKELSTETEQSIETSDTQKSNEDSSGPQTAQQESEPDSEEITDLHDQLGCLMKDSLGEYRYVEPYSDITFNATVCSMKDATSPEDKKSKIITPLQTCEYPPQTPVKARLIDDIICSDQPYLPPRDYCNYYVTRFFEEIHCIYWLYPVEQFHARLDETYASSGQATSSSWLCLLYSVFALGSATDGHSVNGVFEEFVSEESRMHPDTKSSNDYLVLAKGLVLAVHDEADLDSVRALAVLSLALQVFGFRITSYLYMGTSVRIAFSLGLHGKLPTTQSPVAMQQNRRIWWTLYILDQEISSRCGNPCITDERSVKIQAPMPSEQIINPGTNTPLGWLSVSVSLCRLKRNIIETVYPEGSDSRTISYSKITHYVSLLEQWQSTMPSHLKWGVPVAPTHRRSIGILHLNYWNAMIQLTQPFLLYLVLRGTSLKNIKRNRFEKLGGSCIDAAKNTLNILKTMSTDQSLSSLVIVDCTCILKVLMILILALVKTDLPEFYQDIEFCASILGGMEQIGFCKTVAQELPIRLASLGIKRDNKETKDSVELSREPALPILWPGFDPNRNYMESTEHEMEDDGSLGDSLLGDMNLYMDMSMDMSSIPMGYLFQPNLNFFNGTFQNFEY